MTLDTTAASGATASTAAPAETAIEDTSLANSNEAPPGEHEPDPEAERKRESRNNQRRIDTLTRTRTEARTEAQFHRQRAEQLEAQLAALQQPRREPGQEPQEQPRDVDREVETRAETLAAAKAATQVANRIFAEGIKTHGEEAFKAAAVTVQDEAGPLYRANGTPTPLGEAIHDAENSAALLHHLGQHPEVAASLQGLSAAQLGRRIARIEADISAEPRRSSAPAPLKPPAGSKGSGAPDAKSDDFMAHKLKQLRGR